MVGLRLNEAKSELESVQDIQFLGLPLLLDQGRASLPVCTEMAQIVPNILPENLVVQRSVPIYGITQLGLRSHPTGSSTLSFIRSDKPVLIATDNTTVVGYINKQGGTHSNLLLRLVLDLFLWLQIQDITPRARHIPVCLNVIADRLSPPNQPIMKEWSLHPEVVNLIFKTVGNSSSGHVCQSPQYSVQQFSGITFPANQKLVCVTSNV